MTRQTFFLTILTLIAFAANSVLCRMALKAELIDPVSFTQIRLFAGAVFLAPFFYRHREALLPIKRRDFGGALALFVYAIAFSLAYVSLDAGAGALVLFGVVQLTMVGVGVAGGARPGLVQWAGVVLAFAGLTYLLGPGLTAPPLAGAGLMAVAGVAWGVYSLLGKGEHNPVGATARNFALAAPLALLLFLVTSEVHIEPQGFALAALSGAIASGAGYVIWYRALKDLTTVNASVVQLAVPAIAALGGVALLGEALTLRLVVASLLILGGIYLTTRFGERAG